MTLAIADGGGLVLLWNWRTGKTQSIKAHDLPVQSLAFSADGETLATGGMDESIKLWDLRTLQSKPARFDGQMGAVWSLAFSPDGKLLASGSRDMPINLWTLQHLQSRTTTITNLNSEKIGNFTFSPDGQFMAAGCKDDSVGSSNAERKIPAPGGQSGGDVYAEWQVVDGRGCSRRGAVVGC
jgi:WD40 repeat protein